MKYRPDIDGLRAVAVLPVLAFHLDEHWLSGGFVGVDIFFVISGFLIIGIIHDELQADRFSVLRFYDRRIRRILPAYLLVLLVTCMLSLLYLFPEDLRFFGKTVAASVFSVSNILFWRATDGYFAPEAELFPLLHTWSLSVEEQFYLVIPPLMILTARYARKHLSWVFWALFFGSFALSVVGTELSSRAAFYLLPTRAWELLLGGVLSVGLIAAPRSRLHAQIAGIVGAAMIAAAMILFTGKTPFPGFNALLPCGGAALLIWAGLTRFDAPPIMTALLSMRAPVWIGLISYSLYLWHWPLIVFAKRLSVDPLDTIDKVGIAVTAILLAWATRHLIETPFRKGDFLWSTRRLRYWVTGAVVSGMTAFGAVLAVSDGYPTRLQPSVLAMSAQAQDYSPLWRKCLMDAEKSPSYDSTCVFNEDAAKELIIFADSHGVTPGHALIDAAKEHDMRVRFVLTKSCPPAMKMALPADAACARHNRRMVDAMLQIPPTTVVLTAFFFQWELTPEATDVFWEGFAETVSALTAHGHRIVIMGPVPPHEGKHMPSALATWALRGNDVNAYYFDFHRPEAARIDDHLTALADNPNVTYVPIMQRFCDDAAGCKGVNEGSAMFFDRHHLTVTTSRRLIANLIGPAIFTPSSGQGG